MSTGPKRSWTEGKMKHKRYERFLVGMSLSLSLMISGCIWPIKEIEQDAGMREYSSASVLSAAIITLPSNGHA